MSIRVKESSHYLWLLNEASDELAALVSDLAKMSKEERQKEKLRAHENLTHSNEYKEDLGEYAQMMSPAYLTEELSISFDEGYIRYQRKNIYSHTLSTMFHLNWRGHRFGPFHFSQSKDQNLVNLSAQYECIISTIRKELASLLSNDSSVYTFFFSIFNRSSETPKQVSLYVDMLSDVTKHILKQNCSYIWEDFMHNLVKSIRSSILVGKVLPPGMGEWLCSVGSSGPLQQYIFLDPEGFALKTPDDLLVFVQVDKGYKRLNKTSKIFARAYLASSLGVGV